jgi:glucose-6-phosphate isomerase
MMAYADRLERFTRWYVQLWAESLGKDGKGTTPIAALGPVDQHSQLQLFIAGPRDKLFTILTVGAAGRGPRIAPTSPLAGERTLPARPWATRSPKTAPTPRRRRTAAPCAPSTSRRTGQVSASVMHFMLETIIAARLLGVDPFDQPAVRKAFWRSAISAVAGNVDCRYSPLPPWRSIWRLIL